MAADDAKRRAGTTNQTAQGWLFKQRVPVAVKVSPEHIHPLECKHKTVHKGEKCLLQTDNYNLLATQVVYFTHMLAEFIV